MKKIALSLSPLLVASLLVACNTDDNQDAGEENNDQPQEESEDNGETNTNDEDEEVASGEGNGGFLWKVEHGDTEMYLQGTVHLGNDDFYPLDPMIEEAFESADVVLPEFNLLDFDISQEEMLEYAMFNDDTTLDEVLSEETYEELASILEPQGISIEMMNEFQPWYMETLLLELATAESNVDSQQAVDLYFLERAVEDGKEIVDLESAEQQFDMLSNFSMETQVQTLENAVQHFEESPAELEALAQGWLDGDMDAIQAMTTDIEEAGVNEEYWIEMNDNRNIEMANKLDEILQEDSGQTYFVFVGTAHVAIDPSIPTELEEKGYEVTQVY
ncbi:TraB/GumN family protein [Shouchella patagoniensis]|uniref:TraB/GumN family protein n=1 Tax=Shouchella patagoniensis TaxID=228576 RepID=UPI00147586C4|nr:TraB/GumN family protein [Shouchella patagoniensis]